MVSPHKQSQGKDDMGAVVNTMHAIIRGSVRMRNLAAEVVWPQVGTKVESKPNGRTRTHSGHHLHTSTVVHTSNMATHGPTFNVISHAGRVTRKRSIRFYREFTGVWGLDVLWST